MGLQAAPGRRAVGIPLGLGCFILYYITYTTTRMMAEDGSLPLVLGMWLPNILFMLLTLAILYRVNRERPLLPEWLQHSCGLLDEQGLSKVRRLLGRRR